MRSRFILTIAANNLARLLRLHSDCEFSGVVVPKAKSIVAGMVILVCGELMAAGMKDEVDLVARR